MAKALKFPVGDAAEVVEIDDFPDVDIFLMPFVDNIVVGIDKSNDNAEKFNRCVLHSTGKPIPICGDFIMFAVNSKKVVDMTNAQLAYYNMTYKFPQGLMLLGDKGAVFSHKPIKKGE